MEDQLVSDSLGCSSIFLNAHYFNIELTSDVLYLWSIELEDLYINLKYIKNQTSDFSFTCDKFFPCIFLVVKGKKKISLNSIIVVPLVIL